MAFMLRLRLDDGAEWGRATAYATRNARDKAAAFARIIGGLRTHSWTESRAERIQRESGDDTEQAIQPASVAE